MFRNRMPAATLATTACIGIRVWGSTTSVQQRCATTKPAPSRSEQERHWAQWSDPIFIGNTVNLPSVPKMAGLEAPKSAATNDAAAKKTTNELVTETWAVVKSAFELEDVGKLFYKNLFSIAPEIKATVFGNTDHGMQPKRLMTFLDGGIALLDQPEKLVPVLVKCGERHGAYGSNGAWCEKEHYAVAGQALLATLEQGLGKAFTPEVKAAWTAVYGVIEAKFIEGQYNQTGLAIRAKAEAKLAAQKQQDIKKPVEAAKK